MSLISSLILIIPFVLIFFFKNRFVGFFVILVSLVALQTFSAISLLFFHQFNFWTVFSVNLFFAFLSIILFLYLKKKIIFSPVQFSILGFIIFILASIIVFSELFSVHFNYSGTTNSLNYYYKVENASYPFPYYSDEWASVSVVKRVITENRLPNFYPFLPDLSFNNYFIFFHSFLAQVFLSFSMDPLSSYALLALIFGFLVCFSVFIFLRSFGIGSLPASVSFLFMPLVVNGASLPGIWNLIPFLFGFVFLLATILFLKENWKIASIFPAFLAMCFYPPISILVLPIIFLSFFLYLKKEKNKKKIFLTVIGLILFLLICFLTVGFLANLNYGGITTAWTYFLDKFFRPLDLSAHEHNFLLWNVMPNLMFLIIFIAIGIFFRYFFLNFSQKYFSFLFLIVPWGICGSLWFLGSFFEKEFILGFPRAVVIFSYLSIILAGFGFQQILNWFQKEDYPKKNFHQFLVFLIIFAFFLIPAFSYTKAEGWRKLYDFSALSKNLPESLKFKDSKSLKEILSKSFSPPSPANQYLHVDDLKIFSKISRQRILAPAWKGLIISAISDNYSLTVKKSFVGFNKVDYDEFLKKDCVEKLKISKKNQIDYVYFMSTNEQPELNCDFFEKTDSSRENFILYKIVK